MWPAVDNVIYRLSITRMRQSRRHHLVRVGSLAGLDSMDGSTQTAVGTEGCKDDPIGKLQAVGDKLHVASTPVLFFANGQRVGGTLTAEQLKKKSMRWKRPRHRPRRSSAGSEIDHRVLRSAN